MTNTSERIELGACPCCEGEAAFNLRHYKDGKETHGVNCMRCALCVEDFDTQQAAAETWNARPTIAGGVQQGEVREALKELLLASHDAAALPVRGGEQERLEKAQREGWNLLALTPTELRELMWCDVHGKVGSQAKLAKAIGVSLNYLHDVLHGKRAAGKRILEYYHLEERITYVRVGK